MRLGSDDAALPLQSNITAPNTPSISRSCSYATLCNNENPFGMGNLTCISNVEDSKKLSDRKQAMTIVPAYQQVVEI